MTRWCFCFEFSFIDRFEVSTHSTHLILLLRMYELILCFEIDITLICKMMSYFQWKIFIDWLRFMCSDTLNYLFSVKIEVFFMQLGTYFLSKCFTLAQKRTYIHTYIHTYISQLSCPYRKKWHLFVCLFVYLFIDLCIDLFLFILFCFFTYLFINFLSIYSLFKVLEMAPLI